MVARSLFCLVLGLGWAGARGQGLDPRYLALEPVDAHVHVFNFDPGFPRFLQANHLHVLDICVVDKHHPGFEEVEPMRQMALGLQHRDPGHVAWCTTFDPQDFESPGFADRVIPELKSDFAKGAVAVKMYKSIGMELKKKDGRYLLPDDPIFDPIYRAIADAHITLFTHYAAVSQSWEPLDPKDPSVDYYRDPRDRAWYMYLHPERPSKEAILDARDRVLGRFPRLRMVGCHLGCMEKNVNDVARRFERYPNFAVDTAARVPYLMLQDREKVRAFVLRYQDRILYGTDAGIAVHGDTVKSLARWHDTLARDWKYFSTDEMLSFRGTPVHGLALPETVLRKLYRTNAERWVPGIVARAR